MVEILKSETGFNGFTWFASLFLSTSLVSPVELTYHVVSSSLVEPEKFVDGVRVRSRVKVLCGSEISGDFEGETPGFEGLEKLIDISGSKKNFLYKSYCRACLVQASFLSGVYNV